MRKAVALLLFLSCGLTHNVSAAPFEVFITSPNDGMLTIGSAENGKTQDYFLILPVSQSVTFLIYAENAVCGYEIEKTSQLGFLPNNFSFPVSYTDRGKKGERYKISFFQSRSARLTDTPCLFKFATTD